jgi:DNA polymerase-3 subunit epsilon
MQGSLFVHSPMPDTDPTPLRDLDVLVLDCQATAALPRGHLLELGWAMVRGDAIGVKARLIQVPAGARIPRGVARITGISEPMLRAGVKPQAAWQELLEDARTLCRMQAPAVVHFARFERPFLRALAGGEPPLDVICSHEIARRLLPDLPRRTLRALAGYFGHAVGAIRRSTDHVEATAFVWRELVRLLAEADVHSWNALKDWLAARPEPRRCRRRTWPMPRDVRLSLPHAPGVYRMLRTNGDVLYVGKACSLHHRVNSYFRKGRGVPERLLEMLTQARGISFDVAPTALEAAVLEADEIKRHRPPYNRALTDDGRAVWFASPDLCTQDTVRSSACPIGPFPSTDPLDHFRALCHRSPDSLGHGYPDARGDVFAAGYATFCAVHPEIADVPVPAANELLQIGTRLWREGRRDRDTDLDGEAGAWLPLLAWTPDDVRIALEWVVIRAALARRRAGLLTRLFDAAVVWQERGHGDPRLLIIEGGEITWHAAADGSSAPPLPPGHGRPVAVRRQGFTRARFDRLRVLVTELKRLVSEGAPVSVRFDKSPALTGRRLARALWWV